MITEIFKTNSSYGRYYFKVDERFIYSFRLKEIKKLREEHLKRIEKEEIK